MTRIQSIVLLWIALASAPASAQMMESRREQLEGRVLREFVLQSARDLALTSAQSEEIYTLLRSSAEEQRAILRASMHLRTELSAAVQRGNTPDTEFERLLAGLDSLRLRDHRQWEHDQQQLARVLSPRQRAGFALRWIRFQERIRDIVGRRARQPRLPR